MNFEEYIKENREEFTEKVNNISNELGIESNWLMFVMWFESITFFLFNTVKEPKYKPNNINDFISSLSLENSHA